MRPIPPPRTGTTSFYVDEVRAAGAVPVLITSIVRQVFTPDRRIQSGTLVPYVGQIRRIVSEKQVALIDLYRLTVEQAETAGPEGSLGIGRIGPDGKQDTTHLGPKGQQEIGAMAAREFVRPAPPLLDFLKIGASTIHPSK